MTLQLFDRSKITQKPLSERKNKVNISEIYIRKEDTSHNLSAPFCRVVSQTADDIRLARAMGRSVILAFGAHSIKNGLGPLMQEFLRDGWVTHLATNGAGIIHDWEFAYQGKSSEAVYENLPEGTFGTWDETGFSINLAIILGVWNGLGYGASVGKMILEQGLTIPCESELEDIIQYSDDWELVAASADLLSTIRRFGLKAGRHEIPAPYRSYSLQATAYEMGIASTAHPMFGHDIIYTHDISSGAAIGRAAELDFLAFVNNVQNLDGGVYLSVGTAVMSPLVFEKAYSMVQNVALQKGKGMNNHKVVVVDLAESKWDWMKNGEPPLSHPEYQKSYIKSFLRTKPCNMEFLTADNRDFLLALYHELSK
jgi:hypothetical protein